MLVFINGKKEHVENHNDPISLSYLINNTNLIYNSIPAIQVNNKIIPKNKWNNFYINSNDEIEVIQIIAGG